MKMTLKYKINIFRQYLGYYICPLKPPQSHETIPLKKNILLQTSSNYFRSKERRSFGPPAVMLRVNLLKHAAIISGCVHSEVLGELQSVPK
jgi:hypothetical protein